MTFLCGKTIAAQMCTGFQKYTRVLVRRPTVRNALRLSLPLLTLQHIRCGRVSPCCYVLPFMDCMTESVVRGRDRVEKDVQFARWGLGGLLKEIFRRDGEEFPTEFPLL